MQGNSPFLFMKVIGDVLIEYKRSFARDRST